MTMGNEYEFERPGYRSWSMDKVNRKDDERDQLLAELDRLETAAVDIRERLAELDTEENV